MRAALALLVVLATAALASTARAERLVSGISRPEVAITSSFVGETLTLFGNVEPDVGTATSVRGPLHAVVVVTGPRQDRVARRKANVFGIWLNTKQVVFEAFPSFLQILSDARLTDIASPVTLAQLGFLPDQHARAAATGDWWDSVVFGTELVRLMNETGHFGVNEQGVQFRSETLYSAQLSLQADVPPGRYLAHTYIFRDGEVVAERSDAFVVRKIGFERFLGLAATQQPLLYGLAAVILALFTGWLGGIVFRR